MKAAILKNFKDLQIEDVPKPELKKRYVLVRIKAASICGTDIHQYLGKLPVSFPRILGHDASGVVHEIGEGVEIELGQKVAIKPSFPCTRCKPCKRNVYDLCEKKELIGLNSDGCFQEYLLAPESNLIELPGHISFEEGAVLEPFTVALNTFMRLNINAGDTIVVLGQGPIGLGQTAIAKLSGAGEIIVTDIRDEALVLSKSYGATLTINAKREDEVKKIMQITDGKGADVVIESAGTPKTARIMLRLAKKEGKVVCVGVQKGIGSLDIPIIIRDTLTVYGVGGNGGKGQYDRALYLVSRGLINAKKMISHTFPFDKIQEAFTMLSSKEERGKEKVIKTVLEV